ncbi:trans-sulfuration enzyme family protein [Luteibaculum oceani]|uniref:Aminotransferase class I/II-fold pyridoxal phosphate-dependent enzyme n=1 Tax=Luteibaculum oceani TaxID=1294296 RepID=A0A5C6VA20_9FLAO|nr:aminotransferase class I/II-fold pyridoxal phosphate-dependent enzyme [Luteibaculum oceani]TXC82029.1 aminotransferase class I/II-fold pyridoxal phosphate-dependent enzyme [Luteibaculum oceani]
MSKFETLAIREQLAQTQHKEHSAPIFLTSSFTFDSAEEGAGLFEGSLPGNLYSRFSNPNTDELVRKLCLLEQTEAGLTTASGMAAVYTSMAALLQQGDHILSASAIFGNSHHIISNILPKAGITHTYCVINDNSSWEKALQPNTKMLFLETPSNPTLKLADLEFLGKLCKKHGLLFVVDNCFATPYLQQPSKFGADLILHSATKYLDGQGRVLGGAIVGKADPVKTCYDFIRRTGASLSPFNAWVISKSIETLALRMDRHCDNALAIGEYLQSHPKIAKVIYPHLPNFEQYDLAKKQMKKGGGLVGCEIIGGQKAGAKFLNALNMHSLTANLGDSRSIATHPASTTHSKLSAEELKSEGINEGYIRFSVGLEHVDDIIADIDQALKSI